ncbi:MAG: hypothetical protein ACRDIY_00675 [Chloroflexota bacterium]
MPAGSARFRRFERGMFIWLVLAALVALALLLRWAVFARLRIVRAPFCPVCRETRGRVLGVGERTSHPYFRCPHCGNVFDADGLAPNDG